MIHKLYGGKFCGLLAIAGALTACSGGGGGPKPEPLFTELAPDTSPKSVSILDKLDTEALAVGQGLRLNSDAARIVDWKGSTFTKIADQENYQIYMVELSSASESDSLQIVAVDDLKTYLTDMSKFQSDSSADDTNNLVRQDNQSVTDHTVMMYVDTSETSHKRYYTVVTDQNGNKTLGLDLNAYEDDLNNITSQAMFAQNFDNSFALPDRPAVMQGIAVLGGWNTDRVNDVTGQVSMIIDFNALTGNFAAPNLTNDAGDTGYFSGTFGINAETGAFYGTSDMKFKTVRADGSVIGTFDGQGGAATGIAYSDNGLIGQFVAAK